MVIECESVRVVVAVCPDDDAGDGGSCASCSCVFLLFCVGTSMYYLHVGHSCEAVPSLDYICVSLRGFRILCFCYYEANWASFCVS